MARLADSLKLIKVQTMLSTALKRASEIVGEEAIGLEGRTHDDQAPESQGIDRGLGLGNEDDPPRGREGSKPWVSEVQFVVHGHWGEVWKIRFCTSPDKQYRGDAEEGSASPRYLEIP